MKKQILLTIILMVAAIFKLNAQKNPTVFYADTLYISVDDEFRLMVVSENISKYQASDTLAGLIKTFNDDLMKFEMPDLKNRFTQVYFSLDENGNSKIKFKDITDKDKTYVVLDDGETLLPLPVELILPQGQGTRLHLFIDDLNFLDKLEDYNLTAIINEVRAKQKVETPEIRRVAMTTAWKVENGRAAEKYSTHYRNTVIGDQIELSGTVGASIIRNTLVPSVDLFLGFSLANKTRIKHKAGLEISMNYIFHEMPEGGFSTDINTFIGGNYFVNSSKNPDKPNWYGIGVAYLAWQNGEFFEKDTWRVSLGAKFGERYSLMPELYIGDNFNKLMPGLKFRLWL